jgi:hypothetical protein
MTNDIIKKYNEYCDKNFIYENINKFNINFYSDENTQKYIILNSDSKSLWCEYKIILSIDIPTQYILWNDDMLSIEKSIKANNKIKEKYLNKNTKNIEEFLLQQTIDYNYIGLIYSIKNNIKYYFFLTKIIKL